ncbi:Rap1a/Tai family immunity protein [Bradyrhizobium zhanjiangense]|uniref:Rap1a/Tai family immunity protein n=1 Tax=Bradyrhizobium zhanjiangense TaxID=1325107 RepID=UPI001009919A|nr:Rap1a/Tai family immunity protein [Bradyrhizobium zhanjiangense]
MLKYLLAAGFLLTPQVAKADMPDVSGHDLLLGCPYFLNGKYRNIDEAVRGATCSALVAGIAYVWTADICKPQGTTIGQQVRIVLKYLSDNPKELHKIAQEVIFEALKQAWPCENSLKSSK